MFRWLLLSICCLYASQQLIAQRQLKDSLISVLAKGATGPTKVDALNGLAYQFYDYDDSIAFTYATQALAEGTAIGYRKGIKYALTLVGLGYASSGDHKKAMAYYRKSDAIDVPQAESVGIYNINLLANSYRDRGKFDSAEYFYRKAIATYLNAELRWRSTVFKNYGILKMILWKNDEALVLLDSSSALLERSPDRFTAMDLWSAYGVIYKNMLQYDKSVSYFNKVCATSNELEDYFHQIKCLVNRMQLASDKGDYPVAIGHAIEALKLVEIYTFPPQQADLLLEIGMLYTELGQLDVATRYLLQALRVADKSGLQFELAAVYSSLAWIYKDQNNYVMALEYLDRSQGIRSEIGDVHGIATCQNIRGLIFYLQKKYQQSIAEHEKAKKIRQEIKHPLGVAASIFNISLVHIDLKQFDKALALQQEAIAIEEKVGSKQGLGISYNAIASLLIRTKRFGEAETYLKKSRDLAASTQSRLLQRNNAGYFADLYEAQGDLKRALAFRKMYQSINDSLYSESGAVKMAEMQALYQLEKKNQEIELLSKESALQESRLKVQESNLRIQLVIIVGGVVVLVLVSLIAFNAYRNSKEMRKLNMAISEQNEEIQSQTQELSEANQKLTNLNMEILEKNEEIQAQSEELIEANQSVSQINKSLEEKVEERTTELKQAYKELDTFFYRASHDFRRPLTTFMGLAEVAKITIKDQNALGLFEKVNDTAHYLDKMLVKLQSISDVGGQDLVYKEVFLKDIFDNICDAFREDLKRKGIRTFCEIDLKESFYSYPALLRIIIENLIENSIFFGNKKDPVIRFKVYSQAGEVFMQVQDNGEGIPDEFKDRIFEMYFRANERSKGNGLGLYIVKKAVEKLGGSITVKSELYVGTTFTISFFLGTSLADG
jgi:signal transduction histidine kinase